MRGLDEPVRSNTGLPDKALERSPRQREYQQALDTIVHIDAEQYVTTRWVVRTPMTHPMQPALLDARRTGLGAGIIITDNKERENAQQVVLSPRHSHAVTMVPLRSYGGTCSEPRNLNNSARACGVKRAPQDFDDTSYQE